ncbi:MAG: AbrB/MazE/SpoVT family DNA-binding domain-containing protein [Candidatus Riflebacteria bacterium]
MKGKVQMWGNSLAVRIPKAFANEIHLTNNSEVEISLKNGVLQVEPVLEEVDFEKLLEKVNEDNLHELVDFGMPRGKEVW